MSVNRYEYMKGQNIKDGDKNRTSLKKFCLHSRPLYFILSCIRDMKGWASLLCSGVLKEAADQEGHLGQLNVRSLDPLLCFQTF